VEASSSLSRYGLTGLAERAKAFVAHLQAALRQGRQPRLPGYSGPALDARRDGEGAYWA